MTDEPALPFHSFSFTLIEGRRPRAALSLHAGTDGMYELHVERGSAANPHFQFTRLVPREMAQRLKDALQDIGVFGWEESYPDDPSAQPCRWNVRTVFKQDVFSVSSKGGSSVPAGFQLMLDELYKLDFPRPDGGGARSPSAAGVPGLGSALGALGSMGVGSIGGMSVGDIAARSAAHGADGIDFGQIAEQIGHGGMPGLGSSEMAELLSQAQRDPGAIQQRMRDEFQHMAPDEQNQMLDALASLGMASRAWWERFLRGL